MSPATQRLLAGPPLAAGTESLAAHTARLGAVPADATREIVGQLEASGLHGRGGAGFPVGLKWRALAERWSGSAVVVANGAEGEPASAKDRTLMAARPHLILDGAILAAEAVGASEIVVYVGGEHVEALGAMRRAVEERRPATHQALRLVAAPIGYVAGEATAAVHYINDRDPRPLATPPRMSEAGVGGRPTLVQNVESLAYAALIARFGERWYRSVGRDGAAGTALVTVSGAGAGGPGAGGPGTSASRTSRVLEIELGTPLGEVASRAAEPGRSVSAVLLGGYFGTWAPARDVWDLPLEPRAMAGAGLTFGCGLIGLLPAGGCGVASTARMAAFMARSSAGQCGPCVHGLKAIGDATTRVAAGSGEAGDIERLHRWTDLVAGRGACRHPDGVAQLMASALDVFAADFAWHARTGRCSVTGNATEEVA